MKSDKCLLGIFFAFTLICAPGNCLGQYAAADAPEVLTEGIAVPEGTVISIMLADYLNAGNNKAGDVFYAKTVYPIWIRQTLIVPEGSDIRGTVIEAVRPGRIKGKGRLSVRFDDVLLPNGVRHPLSAAFRGMRGPGGETVNQGSESVEGGGSAGEDAETIVGTAASGAVLGTVVGAASGSPGAGAGIGAVSGAAVGVAQALFSRGRNLVIEPGTRFDLELKQPITFALNELEFTDAQLDRAVRSRRTAVAVGRGYDSAGKRPQPRGRGIPGGILGGVF